MNQITHGTEPGRAKNPPGIAEAPHAYVENGSIIVMTGGRYRQTDRWEALFLLMQLEGSPYPSSQERARQIKAALKETMQ